MENLPNGDGSEPKSKEIGVQVKSSTFISLQRKVATLSSCTQTPNLDTDDTYEAALLRGRPLIKPLQQSTKLQFYLNMQERPRIAMSLSARFEKIASNDEDNDIGMYV